MEMVSALSAPSPQPPKAAAAPGDQAAGMVSALSAPSPQPKKASAAGVKTHIAAQRRDEAPAKPERGKAAQTAEVKTHTAPEARDEAAAEPEPHRHHYVIPAPDVGPPLGICRVCGDRKMHNNVFDFEDTTVRRGPKNRRGLDHLFATVAEDGGDGFDPATDTLGEPIEGGDLVSDLELFAPEADTAGSGLEPSFLAEKGDSPSAELEARSDDLGDGSAA